MQTYTSPIYLKDSIAHFPELAPVLIHGFSYGKNSKNMDLKLGQSLAVKKNIKTFLGQLGADFIYNSFNLAAEHLDNIVFLDETTRADYPPRSTGRPVKVDAVFTNQKDLTLTVKPGDCTTAIVYAESSKYGKITGLVHSGRRGITLSLPTKAIKYLVDELSCDLDTLRLAIVPHIFQMSRTHSNESEFPTAIWEKHMLVKDGYFYPDEAGCAIQQYKDAGVLDQNISIYEIDTYQAAKDGESFSYRYHHDSTLAGKDVRNGRFIVATKLR